MAKEIPQDMIVMLHHQLGELPKRSTERRLLIEENAILFGVSKATLYRALRLYRQPRSSTCRADYNQPRTIPFDEMHHYCELIAALKLRTLNKKGRHLSTNACIELLEQHGVETSSGLVRAPAGLLTRTTVSRHLKRFGLNLKALAIQPTVVRFQAQYSNECWQFDFSPSDRKYLPGEPDNEEYGRRILTIASVVDDRSGVMYQEYHYVRGEDAMTALKFLFNAMAPKSEPHFPFQGVPTVIYMDNGPVAKSLVFQRVMKMLGVEIRLHLPDGKDGRRKTARAKGKVERSIRSTKDSLEPLYHFHLPQTLVEANQWLKPYLTRYNQEQHRIESHSRLEDWKKNLPPEGFHAMCDWERFASFAREPETRKVASDACITVNGVRFQLLGELAGLTVILLWGMFDNELHVEHENQSYGPFYPAEGPIPFGQFRKFKKNSREKKADAIEALAKAISIPRSVLTGKHEELKDLLGESDLSLPSTPFYSTVVEQAENFKDGIEAKAAISRVLGFPLGRLLDEQLEAIQQILSETLHKETVVQRVRELFTLRPVNPLRSADGH